MHHHYVMLLLKEVVWESPVTICMSNKKQPDVFRILHKHTSRHEQIRIGWPRNQTGAGKESAALWITKKQVPKWLVETLKMHGRCNICIILYNQCSRMSQSVCSPPFRHLGSISHWNPQLPRLTSSLRALNVSIFDLCGFLLRQRITVIPVGAASVFRHQAVLHAWMEGCQLNLLLLFFLK